MVDGTQVASSWRRKSRNQRQRADDDISGRRLSAVSGPGRAGPGRRTGREGWERRQADRTSLLPRLISHSRRGSGAAIDTARWVGGSPARRRQDRGLYRGPPPRRRRRRRLRERRVPTGCDDDDTIKLAAAADIADTDIELATK